MGDAGAAENAVGIENGAAGHDEAEVVLTLADKLQHAPEMRLIGRRIRLRMDGFAFEGFVIFVTKATVVLMKCEKLTLAQQDTRERNQEEQTRRRRDRRRQARSRRQPSAAQRGEGAAATNGRGDAPEAGAAERVSEADDDGGQGTAPPPREPASTQGAAEEGAEDDDEAASLPHIGSSGPLDDGGDDLDAQLKLNEAEYPFCTFVRRRIHDVRLMPHEDPEPSRQVPDIQLLRACVRRYTIHSTLGNTSRISLDGFLRRRLGWRDIDTDLTLRLQEEEQAVVEKVADEISRERLAAITAAAASRRPIGPPRATDEQRGDANNAPFGDDARLTDEELARAPFMVIGLHTKAMYGAILHLILSMIALLYAASVFSTAEAAVVSPFVASFSTWVAGSATVMLVEAAVLGLHSMRMVVPVPCKLLTVRVVLMLGSLSLLGLTIYITSSSAFEFDNPMGETTEEVYIQQVRDSAQVICSYAATNKCGGWDNLCTSTDFDTTYCPSSCTSVVLRRSETCKESFHKDIRNVILPAVVFQYLAALVMLLDVWCLIRYFMVAADPIGTMERARREEMGESSDDEQH